VARRPVAAVAAVVLVLEAVGMALLNWILGLAVDRQRMSLGGIATHAISVSAWIGGVVFGLYLLCCAFLLLRCAVRDRAPHGVPRIVLITCAVVHGLSGAFCVGLVGWLAFAYLMVVLALLVLVLVAYDDRPPAPTRSRGGDEADPQGPAEPAGDPSPA
jgi:hypothetical protein